MRNVMSPRYAARMIIRPDSPRAAALLVAALLLATGAAVADPLHQTAENAYWHHDSNFLFPAALAGFTRIGAPQEVDGSTTINAHYGGGDSERWIVFTIDLFPRADGAADFAGATSVKTVDLGPGRGSARRVHFAGNIDEVIYSIERGDWRLLLRGRLLEDEDAARIEEFVRALPIERLGTIDTRCPNAGCGT